jgi:hypothetical protein
MERVPNFIQHMKTCNIAFKEWSVIVQALLEGRQTLILRKGGISEEQGRFTIESNEFFLFPTKAHQNAEDLIGLDQQALLQAADGQIAEDYVTLRAFVQVEHYERVRERARILALGKYHLWTKSLIDQRFHYGKEDWLDLFVLRVFRLPKQHSLKIDPSFAGCKSWIHLAESISIQDAQPVIPEKKYRKLLTEILASFGTEQKNPT